MSNPTPPLDLDALLALRNADDTEYDCGLLNCVSDECPRCRYTLAARTALPALIERVRVLEKECWDDLATRTAAQSRIAALEAGLRKHGEHDRMYCRKVNRTAQEKRAGEAVACTCGLDALLNGTDGGG